VALVAAVAAYLIVFDRNTAPSTATPISNDPGYVPGPGPKSVPFTKQTQAAVFSVAQKFLKTCVPGSNAEACWNLSAPTLKQGYTHKEWKSGNPIVPFPVERVKWKLDGSYKNLVYLQVAVWPQPGHDLAPMVFYLDVVQLHRKWLVSDWQPAPGAAQVLQQAQQRQGPPIAEPDNGLSSRWLLAPLFVFVLILGVPLTVGVRDWRRSRRAQRAYESTLPSLSRYSNQ
jgi:hypothetical protein